VIQGWKRGARCKDCVVGIGFLVVIQSIYSSAGNENYLTLY
jgi:hypothetical protein